MSQLTLQDVSKAMRDIDLCMLTTRAANGALDSRPMSNNRKVDYDGDSYFFAYDSSSAAREIAGDPKVNIAFSVEPGLMKNPLFVSVTGEGELVHDRGEMEKRWNPDVEAWFEDGLDTPGIVMIKVHASKLKYWDGKDEGEIIV